MNISKPSKKLLTLLILVWVNVYVIANPSHWWQIGAVSTLLLIILWVMIKTR